jgi:hypothetical protein
VNKAKPSAFRPRRVQLSRQKGWRIPPNTVIVSRPSKWGNPFRFDGRHDRADVVVRFAKWIRESLDGKAAARAAREELRGKNLACWCPLGEPCHADILLRIAYSRPRS